MTFFPHEDNVDAIFREPTRKDFLIPSTLDEVTENESSLLSIFQSKLIWTKF